MAPLYFFIFSGSKVLKCDQTKHHFWIYSHLFFNSVQFKGALLAWKFPKQCCQSIKINYNHRHHHHIISFIMLYQKKCLSGPKSITWPAILTLATTPKSLHSSWGLGLTRSPSGRLIIMSLSDCVRKICEHSACYSVEVGFYFELQSPFGWCIVYLIELSCKFCMYRVKCAVVTEFTQPFILSTWWTLE